MVLEIVYSVSRIAAFLFGTLWKDARIAILFLSLAGFFITIIRLWYVLISSGNKTNYIIKNTIPVVCEAIILLIIPVMLVFVNQKPIIVIFSLIIAFCIFTYRNLKSIKDIL